ncbi:hypothetical protein VP01_2828g1 [Puccinia sorghi]|uniref:Uncharacterized protein n=1 Tax=Puccinia sorghi TaxID=27349 RepID=A0A0L6V316_9BASI|nr:hypothetical protein VP01_2828g1 [Puccinia sorghi]
MKEETRRTPSPSPSTSPSPSPTRSETERRSFQGDHHRHRFMNYYSPNKQKENHLGPPNNAHYSPHYGSQPEKRKPPPTTPLNESKNQQPKSRDQSPSPSPRSAALVKKIGEALSAPFRNSTSRRSKNKTKKNTFSL